MAAMPSKNMSLCARTDLSVGYCNMGGRHPSKTGARSGVVEGARSGVVEGARSGVGRGDCTYRASITFSIRVFPS